MTHTQVATPDKSWIVPVARLGYFAKGVVYALVGALAVAAAVGEGGQTTGATGALQEIATQPFGRVLVGIVGLGLACYAAWRWTQFFADPERDASHDAKGTGKRIGYVASALVHTGLAVTAATMALGSGESGGSGTKTRWTAELMSQPWGRWVVGAVGVGIGIAGIAELAKLVRGRETRKLQLDSLQPKTRKAVQNIARVGVAARGIVFVAIGVLVVRAAVRHDPSQATGGTEQALQLISAEQGWIVLLLVAAGLVCYGIYCFAKGRYRRFRVA